MASIGEDYDAAWDMMERAHVKLREKDPNNTWLQYWNGKTFDAFPCAVAMKIVKDDDNAAIKIIVALMHYCNKLEEEFQRV